MLRRLFLVLIFSSVGLAPLGCGDTQTTETAGLGRSCDHDDDCEQGQACVVTSRTEEGGALTTCQIPCRSSSDCPKEYVCQSGTEAAPTAICVKDD